MVLRRHEAFSEALRKDASQNLFELAHIPIQDTFLCRNVDDEALSKMRIKIICQESDKVRRMTNRSEDAQEMEKARDHQGSYQLGATEFALHDNFQLIYFNYYGHGYNIDETTGKYQNHCNRTNEPWICPGCGLKVDMSMKLLRHDVCPICHHITPIGELKKDGVLHH